MKLLQKFIMTGIDQKLGTKIIEIDPDQTVSSIKKEIKQQYDLDSVLAIQFVAKGIVMNDMDSFSKYQVHPKRDIVTILLTQAGG